MNAAIGIDIGGTNVKVALVNVNGEVISEKQLSVVLMGTRNLLFTELKQNIEKLLLHQVDLHLDGIGIGSPGANIGQGIIEKASNLPWKELPIVDFLQSEFGVPVYLTNDANLFAIGEKVFGEAKDLNDFVVLTLGTGVGAGIYCGGSLLLGRDGLAGEVGHQVIVKNGRHCQCGRNGCLERYVSAGGLVASARELIRRSDISSVLRDLPEQELTAAFIATAAAAGDVLSLEVFEYTGEILGEALANLLVCLNPETIFLAGGLSKAGAVLFQPTINSFIKNQLNIYPQTTPILPCSIPDDQAGVMGAAALVWDFSRQINRFETSSVTLERQ